MWILYVQNTSSILRRFISTMFGFNDSVIGCLYCDSLKLQNDIQTDFTIDYLVTFLIVNTPKH